MSRVQCDSLLHLKQKKGPVLSHYPLIIYLCFFSNLHLMRKPRSDVPCCFLSSSGSDCSPRAVQIHPGRCPEGAGGHSGDPHGSEAHRRQQRHQADRREPLHHHHTRQHRQQVGQGRRSLHSSGWQLSSLSSRVVSCSQAPYSVVGSEVESFDVKLIMCVFCFFFVFACCSFSGYGIGAAA